MFLLLTICFAFPMLQFIFGTTVLFARLCVRLFCLHMLTAS